MENSTVVEILAASYAEASDWINTIKYQKQSVDILGDGKLE